MPFTVAAWSQSVAPAGAFVAITFAAQETNLTTSGTNIIFVPALNRVVALAAGVETTAAQQARLTAPSRRILALQRIAPTQGNAAAASLPGDPHKVIDLRDTPLIMVAGESAQIEINSTPAAAQIQWGIVWFADGPIAPAAVQGEFTIRATGATALVAQQWTPVTVTFSETLPRGLYQIVGFRAQSANLVAARLVFPGTGAAGWRPGVLGTNTDRHLEHPMFRHGELGVWGTFEDTAPPVVECLGAAADATETFYFDLVQARQGPGGA